MGRFSIEEFKAQVDKSGGFAKPNRFFVSFVPPQKVFAKTRLTPYDIGTKIEFFCEGINLPGYQLQMVDNRRYTYGPTEKIPFAPHFNPLQLTVMADGHGTLWTFFQEWMNYIHNHELFNPEPGVGVQIGTSTSSPRAPYELAYKQDYVCEMAIFHVPETYDYSSHPSTFTNRTICYDCFPSNLIDMPLNWADNNNISRFGVQIEYLEHWYGPIKSDPKTNPRK